MFYETASGDTWDQIALFIYGNEMYADWLMKNNPSHLATMIFESGVLIYTPDLPAEDDDNMPEWRS